MSAEDKNEIEEDIVFESNSEDEVEENDSIVSEADMILGNDEFDDLELNEDIIFGEHEEQKNTEEVVEEAAVQDETAEEDVSEEFVVEASEENEDEGESDFSFYSEEKNSDFDDQISNALSNIADEMIDTPKDENAGEEQLSEEDDEDREFSMVNAALASQFGEDGEEEAEPEKKKKKSIVPMWLMVALCIVFGIAIAGGLLIGTKGGQRIVYSVVAKIIASKVEFDDGKDVTPIPDSEMAANSNGNGSSGNGNVSSDGSGDKQQDSSGVQTPSAVTPVPGGDVGQDEEDLTPPGITGGNTKPGEARHEDGIYNIVLLGEESIGTKKGRTDAFMIATMDTINNQFKLTSILRDTLVTIEGSDDNSINTVYAKGGIQLVYKVLEQNFNIKVDGYVLVNFDCFEELVDAVGGVDIELTEREAEYLNTTNYISEEKYRTMVPGVNHMNGNQALGYCRVRRVSTISGESIDFGRTTRHREVLNAIFNKCKTSNMFELTNLMLKVLTIKGIKTDITENMWYSYLEKGFDILKETGGINIEEKMIPVGKSTLKKGYEYSRKGNREYIVLNWPMNIEALHTFIFGNYIE